jgi:hypothetical protein
MEAHPIPFGIAELCNKTIATAVLSFGKQDFPASSLYT